MSVIKVFVDSVWWKDEIVAWETPATLKIAPTFNFWINKRELILAYLKDRDNPLVPSSLFQPIILN